MPPKRAISALNKTRTPTRTKLEEVDTPFVSSSKKLSASSSKKPARPDSDDDSEAAPRRSPRKRQRVEPKTEPVEHESSLTPKSDDESSLTSLGESDYEDVPAPSAGTRLAKFAYSSRPSRATAKTPTKQLKLEETLGMPIQGSPSEDTDIKTSARKVKVSTSPSKKATNPSPRKKKGIVMELDKPHPAPPNWERQYRLIEEMRANVQAPVDTMGCAKAMSGEGDLKDQRYGALVSLMLSSQTRDEITAAAVGNLRAVLPGGLSITSLLAADPSVISNAINKVGFWRRKTEYLRGAAEILRDKFDGDVPKTIDELCSLPGVGPKMAFLVLQVAWDINVGIGVDVHVHRISNRLGWHKPPTNTPEQTRLNLQSWLPRNLHKPINPLLVGFGQIICLPVGPRCDSCTLSTEGLCPSARTGMSAKGRKPIVYSRKTEPKAETPEAPDLDVVGLIRVDDGVKKEEEEVEVDCAVGEPRIQIKFEE